MQVERQSSDQFFCASGVADQSCAETAPWRSIAEYYFGRVPISHAVFRVAELELIAGLRLNRPVLEIGCGRGEFAEAAMLSPIDFGVDISDEAVEIAARSGYFDCVCHADARQLPFPSETIATAISISVLEHVPSPNDAIAEAYRVLMPGGKLIATLVLADIHDCSPINSLFKRLRMKRAGKLYRWCSNRIFRHHTLLSRDEWEEMFSAVGFTNIQTQLVVPPAVLARWERRLITAWPYRISKRVAKVLAWRSDVSRLKCFESVQRMIQNWRRDGGREGACLFIHAQKPAT